MKSAYELAMERLEKEDPDGGLQLTDEQKDALAETDRTYKAKIAEREVFLKGKLLEAARSGDAEAVGQLEEQLRNERLRLQEECDSKKEKIRKGNK